MRSFNKATYVFFQAVLTTGSELRVERIWEGASEVQRVIVADQLGKRGLQALV